MTELLTYMWSVAVLETPLLNRCPLILSTLLFIGTAQSLAAQQSVPVLPDTAGNFYYGEYEVTEGHPACSGEDKIAFRLPMIADRVDYQAFDSARGASVVVSREPGQGASVCYTTERRGTTVRRTRTNCEGGRPSAVLADLEALDVTVNLHAYVTACVSPLGFEVIGNEWAVTVSTLQEEQVFRGSSDTARSELEGQNNWINRRPPRATFTKLDSNVRSGFRPRFGGGGELPRLLRGKNGWGVKVECLPVNSDWNSARPWFVSLWAVINAVDKPAESCEGESCPEPWETGGSPYFDMARACLPN